MILVLSCPFIRKATKDSFLLFEMKALPTINSIKITINVSKFNHNFV